MSSSKQKQSDSGTSGGGRGPAADGQQRPGKTDGRTPFSRRHPVLKAVIIFGVLMGGYYVLEYRFMLQGQLEPYLSLIASISARALSLLGHDTISDGRWVASKMFKVQIIHGCDALEPTAAYLAALLASPVAFRAKVPGVVIGVIALLSINLIRIVGLFLIGAYFPRALDIMHYEIGQAVFIVLAIVFWAIWVQWATRDKPVVAESDVPV